MKSSDSSFAKASSSESLEINEAEGDVAGPFAIGVEVIKTMEDGTEARLVAFGSSQIFTDEVDSMVAGANQMLFTNCMSQLSDLDVSVSIPVKSYELSMLTVNESEATFYAILTVAVIPLGCLVVGFVIWLRRRKK